MVTGTAELCLPAQAGTVPVTARTAPATSGSVGSRQPEQSSFLSIAKHILLIQWKHNHIDNILDV